MSKFSSAEFSGNESVFRCVAFLARPHLRRFSINMAKRLKQEYGSRIVMYCKSPEEASFYISSGAFDEVPIHQKITLEKLGKADLQGTIQRARRIEARYGVPMNQLALTNRHLGRGFALGGFHHPRSQLSEAATYEDMLNLLCDQVEFWETDIQERGVTLFLNADRVSTLVLEKLDIPVRSLVFARVENRYMWTFDAFDRTPLLPIVYDSLADCGDFPPHDPEPPVTQMDNRKRVLKAASSRALLKRLARTMAQQAYWRLRGYQAAKSYLLSERLRGSIRQWRDLRRVTGSKTVTLKELEGQPFVFYPLHVEPEKALQVLSPLNFYQLSTIAGLARDLPAGVLLVVKEHAVATGRRPAEFYDQIQDFKNVRLLNMTELGVNIVREAQAVATITSTAGVEAAMAGKPVITFGRNNIYNILPHVRLITDEADLKGAIDWALSGAVDSKSAKADAARYVAAIKKISFDFTSFSASHPDDMPEEVTEPALRHLAETLRQTPYDLPLNRVSAE